jgi:pimeloyl-ACP methyl ester carboxylesterase
MAYFKYDNHNIYYEEIGNGSPLFLLHGNTASSKMFDDVIALYKDFQIILVDFLGHGKSDRLTAFPVDLWFSEAMQVIELIEQRQYGKAHLIGTSGGALVALNVALERGDLVNKVVADSFEGEKSLPCIAEIIANERHASKASEEGYGFWEYCHGHDWESVVDNDTAAVIKHDEWIKNFFHKDLSQLCVPVLLTASLKDEFALSANLDFVEIYGSMIAKIKMGNLHLFESGGHPAMITNALAFASIAKEFIR